MKKKDIIAIIVLLVVAVCVGIYFLIKNKKTASTNFMCEAEKDTVKNNSKTPVRTVDNTENSDTESEDEPFMAEPNAEVDTTQSRTTDEYVEWQKNQVKN